MKKMLVGFKKAWSELKQEKKKNMYIPAYRLLEILQDEEGSYTVHIQLIGKTLTFHAKPEELLADDKLVDQFSPRDVRTLTYLGYLGINAPKYKILAQRMIEDNKIVFAIKKRGEKEVIVKTGEQILQEREMIASMHPDDAKTVGYRVATESFQSEKKEKEKLLASQLEKHQ